MSKAVPKNSEDWYENLLHRFLIEEWYHIEECDHLEEFIDFARKVRDEEIETLRDALGKIAEGRAPFSRDRLTHAENCIEMMQKTANDALTTFTAKEPLSRRLLR